MIIQKLLFFFFSNLVFYFIRISPWTHIFLITERVLPFGWRLIVWGTARVSVLLERHHSLLWLRYRFLWTLHRFRRVFFKIIGIRVRVAGFVLCYCFCLLVVGCQRSGSCLRVCVRLCLVSVRRPCCCVICWRPVGIFCWCIAIRFTRFFILVRFRCCVCFACGLRFTFLCWRLLNKILLIFCLCFRVAGGFLFRLLAFRICFGKNKFFLAFISFTIDFIQ